MKKYRYISDDIAQRIKSLPDARKFSYDFLPLSKISSFNTNL